MKHLNVAQLLLSAFKPVALTVPPLRRPLPADAVPAEVAFPSRQVRRQAERRQAKAQRSRDKVVARIAAKAWRAKRRAEARKAAA